MATWRHGQKVRFAADSPLEGGGFEPSVPAWLADVLHRIADYPASRLHELLPWNWKVRQIPAAAA